jgi:hypothetical protein
MSFNKPQKFGFTRGIHYCRQRIGVGRAEVSAIFCTPDVNILLWPVYRVNF